MKVMFDKLLDIYNKEIRKNTKNKKKVYYFEIYKMSILTQLAYELENNLYYPGKYNVFFVYEPKIRVIMSLSIRDKVVNHYVAKYILMPKLNKYLDIRNVATRINMGSSYGIKLILNYLEKNKKYEKFYILKIDIKKYFYNIDHNILLDMLKGKLSNDEYILMEKIISSTGEKYINESIKKCKCKNKSKRNEKSISNIPFYNKNKGLSIGAMSSQFLSIFFLYELDHFIINDLKIKYYCRYMDDLILISNERQKLNDCIIIIGKKLRNEYKLDLNDNKVKIYDNKDGFSFLGYKFKVINKKTIVILSNQTRKKSFNNIKCMYNKYQKNKINYRQYFNSISNYFYSYKLNINNELKYCINHYNNKNYRN